jgi:hypothetical protein
VLRRTVEGQLRWLLDTNSEYGLELPLPMLCRFYEEMAEHFKPRWRYATAEELMAAAAAP